jgi:hypothetical protein
MAAQVTRKGGGQHGQRRRRGTVMALLILSVLAAGTGSAAARGPAAPAQVHVVPSGATGSVGVVPQIWQTYNNCGPASIAEVLAYWGISRTQYQVQRVVRADNSPGGMFPYGVPSYARSVGMRALMGVAGTSRLLKALISNGFPIIINQWYSVAEHTRHYRPIQSYNDGQSVFVASDPLGGPNHAISYAAFAAIWAVSNNRFFVLYPPAKAPLLNAVLAVAGWNKTRAYVQDLAKSEARLRTRQPPLTPRVPATHRSYGYLNIAWDEMELGRYAAARQALRQAVAHSANPIQVRWIAGEIPG